MNKDELREISKCKNVEEVLKLANDNGYEINQEKAQELFNSSHSNGELSDSELDNVAGGGTSCNDKPKVDRSLLMEIEYFPDKNENHYIFNEGQEVKLNYLTKPIIGIVYQRQFVKDVKRSTKNKDCYYDRYWVKTKERGGIGPYSRENFYKTI